MSETPPSIDTLAPQLGAHTREVLGECGYSAAEIDALLASGVAKAR
jgi:crotonobetainyl-CoA:carnitine CoA-transferase CaiB-like acyl-CoA transferase